MIIHNQSTTFNLIIFDFGYTTFYNRKEQKESYLQQISVSKVLMESLPIIAEVGNGARTITPSKVSRGGTPIKLRASFAENQRAISASRLLRTATAHVVPQLKRHASARRARRWENANMFGLEGHVDRYLEDSDEENGPNHRSAFSAETKTSFESLLASKDEELIERFRRGEENPFSHHSHVVLPPHMRSNLSLVEKGLLSVDKRIRKVLIERISENQQLLKLMFQTEQLLFTICEDDRSHLKDYLLRAEPFWNRWLTHKINENSKCELELHFKQHSQSSNTSIASSSTSQRRKVLRRNDKEAAFLRLLIHGVCQFHHVPSTSVAFSSETENSSKLHNLTHKKLIRIFKPKVKSLTIEKRVSLAEFLFLGAEGNITDLFLPSSGEITEAEASSGDDSVEDEGDGIVNLRKDESLSPSLEESYVEAMKQIEEEEFVVVDDDDIKGDDDEGEMM